MISFQSEAHNSSFHLRSKFVPGSDHFLPILFPLNNPDSIVIRWFRYSVLTRWSVIPVTLSDRIHSVNFRPDLHWPRWRYSIAVPFIHSLLLLTVMTLLVISLFPRSVLLGGIGMSSYSGIRPVPDWWSYSDPDPFSLLMKHGDPVLLTLLLLLIPRCSLTPLLLLWFGIHLLIYCVLLMFDIQKCIQSLSRYYVNQYSVLSEMVLLLLLILLTSIIVIVSIGIVMTHYWLLMTHWWRVLLMTDDDCDYWPVLLLLILKHWYWWYWPAHCPSEAIYLLITICPVMTDCYSMSDGIGIDDPVHSGIPIPGIVVDWYWWHHCYCYYCIVYCYWLCYWWWHLFIVVIDIVDVILTIVDPLMIIVCCYCCCWLLLILLTIDTSSFVDDILT